MSATTTLLVRTVRPVDHDPVVGGDLPPAPWRPGPVVLFAVMLTALVASATFSGAITTGALILGLAPSLLLSAGCAAVLARTTSVRIGAASGVVVALAAAEVVNVVAGADNGPAARSTLAAAGLAALAAALVGTRRPAAFLAPVAGIVAAAAGLGAGAEVQGVAAVTGVTSVVTLALVEQQIRRWQGRRRRGWVTMLVLMALCAVAVGVTWMVLEENRGPVPAVFSATSVDSHIRPPVVGVGLAQLRHHREQAPAPARRSAAAKDLVRHPEHSTSLSSALGSTLIRLLMLLLVAAVVGVILWRLWVVIGWRRLRSRLRQGAPADVVAGAWVWTQRKLGSFEAGLPPSLSADRIAAVGVPRATSRRVARPLGLLAGQVTVSTFSGAVTSPEAADDAWRLAGESITGARRGLSLQTRVRSWFRSPRGHSTP
jgi:hypothetical protein